MITNYQIAKARGARADVNGIVSVSEFKRVGFQFMTLCQRCSAELSPYDAYPGFNGYAYCYACADPDLVFATVEEFEAVKKKLCDEAAEAIADSWFIKRV